MQSQPSTTLSRSALVAALGVALLSHARAQSSLPVPASLLIHPEFDNTPGHATLITVTNTNLDPSDGLIFVRFVYVAGDTCLELDRLEALTPGDTFTALSTFHDPQLDRGYCYVYAVDNPGMQTAVAFDHLIGSATQLDAFAAFQYEVQPFAFRAIGSQGTPTDVNANERQDLDGLEYEQCFDELRIPRFHGQAAPNVESHLVLLNLTGALAFDSFVDFLVWNDNQVVLSQQWGFRCWTKLPLMTIGQSFGNEFLKDATDHDLDEPIGAPAIENGWVRVDGNVAVSDDCSVPDPAILGLLIERVGGSNPTASLPFVVGTQANGSLIEHATVIDDCGP